MASMLRRLFTIAPAFSLLLCAVTASLWVRSYHYTHLVMINFSPYLNTTFATGNGGFYGHVSITRATHRTGIEHYPYPSRSDEYASMKWWYPQTFLSQFGFIEHHESNAQFKLYAFAAVPIWSVVVTTLLAPMPIIARRLKLRRRRRRCQCIQCGYDLRASQGRCPECGTAIPFKKEFASIQIRHHQDTPEC